MDTFGDFFRGNINDSIAIREFLEPYKTIAAEYGCVILFLHHIAKGKENNASPSKNDSLGSQGLESSCRTMLGLSKRANGKRELSILKANNTLDKFTEDNIELELLEKGGFIATGKIKPQMPNKSAAEITAETIQMVKEVYKVEKSLKKTSDALKEKEIYFDKNKVGLIIKMNPSVQTPGKKDDGQAKKAA
jgi:RecA-family ATPase